MGLPNAGKSSLLARLTRAHPKVAGYPFTTVEPVLGTLDRGDRQLVIADIPGLIEGASTGAGLGHEFLAHVERTRLLVHVLDIAPLDGSDPAGGYETVERELREHGAGLERLPRIVCLSKVDLVPAEEADAARERMRSALGGEVLGIVVTSAVTGRGLDELADAILEAVPVEPAEAEAPPPERLAEPEAEHRLYRPAAGEGFEVSRTGEGSFRVTGVGVERLIARHDTTNEEALAYLEGRLRAIGVIGALEAAGFTPGDDVEIGGVVFELDPGAPLR